METPEKGVTMRRRVRMLVRVVLLALCIVLAGCSPASLSLSATDLTAGARLSTSETPLHDTLAAQDAREATYDFSLRLLRSCLAEGKAEDVNVLVSPLSVLYALSMVENGAGGPTLAQMEEATGLPADALASYLNAYARRVSGEDLFDPQVSGSALPLSLANSVWLRDDGSLTVRDEFLAACGERLDAEAYAAPFDQSTVRDINAWVSDKTDGMIPEVLGEIPDAAQLYLVNALAFDDAWAEPYEAAQVSDWTFTSESGAQRHVQMMLSREGSYLEGELATGFIRPYENNDFAFVGLLPNEGVSVGELLESLDGAGLQELLTPVGGYEADAGLPKFEDRYQTELSDALRELGMTDAFDPETADFERMGSSAAGPLYVSKVLHETYVDVNEEGTRAAAVTVVGMESGSSAPMETSVREVILDRPFVYLIIDYQTGTPIFIGAVTSLG